MRLPKSCRFADGQREVLVRRVGRRVVLEPADEWTKEFRGTLGAWKGQIKRPRGRPVTKLRNPFE